MAEIRQTYPLSTGFWVAAGAMNVTDVTGSFVASIPIGFMQDCDCRNWAFIKEVLIDCVESAGVLLTASREQVDTSTLPVAGDYIFQRNDDPNLPVNFRKGPQSNRRGRAMIHGGSESTVSDSKRSTPQQNRFRTTLIARDGTCLLTDSSYIDCTAAHIIPFSRSDIYTTILGYPEQYLYHTWMGLLLEDKLHHAHDRGDWALYPSGKNYVVHYFDHSQRDRKDLHGKIIEFDRFRGEAHLRPRADLLKWHHRQCVQMHFRGFSYAVADSDAVKQSVALLR